MAGSHLICSSNPSACLKSPLSPCHSFSPLPTSELRHAVCLYDANLAEAEEGSPLDEVDMDAGDVFWFSPQWYQTVSGKMVFAQMCCYVLDGCHQHKSHRLQPCIISHLHFFTNWQNYYYIFCALILPPVCCSTRYATMGESSAASFGPRNTPKRTACTGHISSTRYSLGLNLLM